jgi:hypothetical protein
VVSCAHRGQSAAAGSCGLRHEHGTGGAVLTAASSVAARVLHVTVLSPPLRHAADCHSDPIPAISHALSGHASV